MGTRLTKKSMQTMIELISDWLSTGDMDVCSAIVDHLNCIHTDMKTILLLFIRGAHAYTKESKCTNTYHIHSNLMQIVPQLKNCTDDDMSSRYGGYGNAVKHFLMERKLVYIFELESIWETTYSKTLYAMMDKQQIDQGHIDALISHVQKWDELNLIPLLKLASAGAQTRSMGVICSTYLETLLASYTKVHDRHARHHALEVNTILSWADEIDIKWKQFIHE